VAGEVEQEGAQGVARSKRQHGQVGVDVAQRLGGLGAFGDLPGVADPAVAQPHPPVVADGAFLGLGVAPLDRLGGGGGARRRVGDAPRQRLHVRGGPRAGGVVDRGRTLVGVRAGDQHVLGRNAGQGGDQFARAERLRPLDRDDVDRDDRDARRAVVEDERAAEERITRARADDGREPAGDVQTRWRRDVDAGDSGDELTHSLPSARRPAAAPGAGCCAGPPGRVVV
jgi:hypothetical protein